jgi:hypothetical protein
MQKRSSATGGLALLVALSQMLLVLPAGSGDTRLSTFSTGENGGEAVFGPGGGNSTPLQLSLPGDAYVLNASLSLEGKPRVLSGGFEATTDSDFAGFEMTRNITVSGGSVRLTSAAGGWAQSADAEFASGRPENMNISGGAKLARGPSFTAVVGNRTVSPFKASQLDAAAAVGSTGNLVLAWADLRSGASLDIYARIIDPSGSALSPDIVVCDAAGHQRLPALALDGSDNIFVAWQDSRSGDSDIHGRKLSPDGTPSGAEFVVCNAAGDQGRPSLCPGPSGKMLAAWDDFRDGKHFAARTQLLGSDGTPDGPENRVLPWPVDQLGPQVCRLATGFALVFQNSSDARGADIEGCLLDDAGAPAGRFPVSSAPFNQSSPRIAAGPQGRFCVVWEDRRGGADFDIRGRWFDASGRPAGNETAVSFGPGDQMHPSVSVSSSGEAVVAWEDWRSGGSDVYYKVFDASWNAEGTEAPAADGPRDQDGPAVAFGPGGSFFVAWSDWSDGLPNLRMEKLGNPAYRYTSGMLVSPPIACFAATYGSAGLCITLPSTTRSRTAATGFRLDVLDGAEDLILQKGLLPGDHILVEPRLHPSIRLAVSMWTRDGNLTPVMRRWSVGTGIEEDLDGPSPGALSSTRLWNGELSLARAGAPGSLSEEFPVKNSSAGSYQVSLGRYQDGTGDFAAAWRDGTGSSADIRARRFTRDGTPVTAEAAVCSASGLQQSPSLAVDVNGVATVAWADNRTGAGSDIYLRRLAPDLSPSGPELLVCGSAAEDTSPRVSVDPENNIVVVWVDHTLVYSTLMLRKYRADLAPLSDPVRVSYSDLSILQPALATDSAGRIIMAWVDYRNANPDIYAAIYLPDCTPLSTGKELAVAARPGDQYFPAVAVDQDDRFLVAWEDRPAQAEPQALARLFDLNGTAIGGDIVISAAAGAQMRPAVAFDSTGGFMAVWQSYNKAFDLVGKYFDPSGTPSSQYLICNAINKEGNAGDHVFAALACGPDDDFVTVWEDNREMDNMDLWGRPLGFPSFAASGTFTSRAYDLVRVPLSLDEAGWNASLPAGTSVSASLRSSADGYLWGVWETVSSRQSTLSTTPARHLQWRFTLSTTVANQTPVLQGFYLRYTTYATNGTMVSPPLEVPFGITEAVARWNASLDGEAMAVELTSDNGTRWTGCRAGEPVAGDRSANRSVVRCRVFLWSNGSSSPELEDLQVEYSATSFPSDAWLDIGADGAVEWRFNGTFNTTVRLAGLEGALNALLAAGPGGDAPVAIPLALGSASPGIIDVSNLSVVFNAPPVITVLSPRNEDLSIDEGGSVDFSVSLGDRDGDELSWAWTVNGRPVQNGETEYRFAPDFSSSGQYEVAIAVTDGFWVVNRTWHITVRDVNRPPLLEWYPPRDVTLNETEKVSFYAVVSDPDGEPVSVNWSLDGSRVASGTSWEYLSDYNSSGVHNVTVAASDGRALSTHTWTVTVLNRNRAPVITRAIPAPAGVVKAYKNRPATFSVQAYDPDGGPLTFRWKLNNAPVPGEANSSFICRKGLSLGRNTVTVEVSDGETTTLQQWEVGVSLAPEDQVTGNPLPGMLLAGALLVIILIGIVAIYMMMRKRKAP